MHLASFYGDFLAVQFMLRLGGNEHIKDRRDNKQVLDYAANGLVRGVLIDLKEAARKGDEKSFDFLLNCGNKIDERKTIYNIAPVHNVRITMFFLIFFRQFNKSSKPRSRICLTSLLSVALI
jgi:hypothetical protein